MPVRLGPEGPGPLSSPDLTFEKESFLWNAGLAARPPPHSVG